MRRTHMRHLTRGAALAASLAMSAALAGCGAVNPRSPEPGGGPLDLGTPGEVIAVQAGVEYYPACGNEVLTFEGKDWFPYQPANIDDFPSVDAQAGPSIGLPQRGLARALPAVAAPGPGDDEGTLTLYEGDLAYWVSDSGDLDTWLTNRELTYNWVC